MSFRPAVAYKHFNHKKQKCNGKEVHELLVEFLKHERAILLVFHFLYVIYYRIESELAVSGTHLDSVSGSCDILKHLLV